ncbi:aldose epimerase family protein [Lapillicoccus jejuensis]|uniref:Aldose 1-epimerase n=1 Tax=Lapillicoccus jejuensis TaxID=402171 RepID=A0A542DXX6_9MICO|nr:aldose epimerase family protein [Lapillicoccus jejuensis]TQJ07943.1 aldose 1-epimerase [Lapillicoccus jejuensis]
MSDATAVLRSADLEVEVLPRGATLHRVRVRALEDRDVVLGHADLDRVGVDPGYLGASVGRYANRIRDGRVVIDGHEHRLTTNEGPHTLHGGVVGLDRHDWTVEAADDAEVVLSTVSEDGDQGFPGRLEVRATYRLQGPRLSVTYDAVTDAPTPVGLASHVYWNLRGEGSGSVHDHRLGVAARAVVEVDDALLPTGRLLPTRGTPFDLAGPRAVGEVVAADHPQLRAAGGLDHCYVLDQGRDGRVRPVATLAVDDLRLVLATDQPGLQVYAGGQLDGTSYGWASVRYTAGAGIALEAQSLPDAPNQPTFPPAVLRPGGRYVATTAWTLEPSPA